MISGRSALVVDARNASTTVSTRRSFPSSSMSRHRPVSPCTSTKLPRYAEPKRYKSSGAAWFARSADSFALTSSRHSLRRSLAWVSRSSLRPTDAEAKSAACSFRHCCSSLYLANKLGLCANRASISSLAMSSLSCQVTMQPTNKSLAASVFVRVLRTSVRHHSPKSAGATASNSRSSIVRRREEGWAYRSAARRTTAL